VTTLSGKVVAFDREVGLGDVAAADGTVYPFHCIEISDGSRDISPDTPVTFSLIGKLGRYEAAHITPA
jgi:cold shock CspA family protein